MIINQYIKTNLTPLDIVFDCVLTIEYDDGFVAEYPMNHFMGYEGNVVSETYCPNDSRYFYRQYTDEFWKGPFSTLEEIENDHRI